MRYRVTVGSRDFEVVVNGGTVSVDGEEVAATLIDSPDHPVKTLRLGDASVTLSCEPTDDGWVVQRSGDVVTVAVEDERDRLLRRFGGSEAGASRDGLLKAPMPGLVLRVAVAEGDAVEAGAGLLVLEAMKMENEIKSPLQGRVKRVLVEPGQAVDKGTPLLEVVEEG